MKTEGDYQTGGTFCSQQQATELLSLVTASGSRLTLQAHEDKCFDADQWLNWGRITLSPAPLDDPEEQAFEDAHGARCQAITNGSWLWATPTEDELSTSLSQCLSGLEGEKAASTTKSLVETMQDCARRLGLLFPSFALDTLSDWPYERPATWVLDTSALSQGAADFARIFLFPMVRLRIPSLVSVEVLNMCDRFFSSRNGPKALTTAVKKANCLKEHLKSQGAQRVLLRLEWHSAVEIERAAVGSDPLRFVFQNDADAEVRDLNLSAIQKSLGDRLIFETAKEHRSRLSVGQPVHIVTSDQGMARMALGEGMTPVYFDARHTAQPLGRRLAGTTHHPFTSALHCVSLVDLLWETATCFGAARLSVEGVTDVFFEAIALSNDVSWSPDHTKENLFFCRWRFRQNEPPTLETVPASAEPVDLPLRENEPEIPEAPVVESPVEPVATNEISSLSGTLTPIGGYIFKTEKMLRFISALAEKNRLSDQEGCDLTGIKIKSFSEYRKFLHSCGLLNYKSGICEATPKLLDLQFALSEGDLITLNSLFQDAPSYEFFLRFVEQNGRRSDWRDIYPVRTMAIPNYRELAEVCGQVLVIPERGLCVTPQVPNASAFADVALQHYEVLAAQEWVETGKWLEALAWESGIHPAVARRQLEAAREEGFLNRYFEGSTPETQFDDHFVHVLEQESRQTVIRKYYLYRGDFLWSERPSVRIKLQRRHT